jgi:hypothetical protein
MFREANLVELYGKSSDIENPVRKERFLCWLFFVPNHSSGTFFRGYDEIVMINLVAFHPLPGERFSWIRPLLESRHLATRP